jgi:hypothetical protein
MRSHKRVEIKVFSYFCLLMEGFGTVQIITDPDPGGPYIRILWIHIWHRIRNTACAVPIGHLKLTIIVIISMISKYHCALRIPGTLPHSPNKKMEPDRTPLSHVSEEITNFFLFLQSVQKNYSFPTEQGE